MVFVNITSFSYVLLSLKTRHYTHTHTIRIHQRLALTPSCASLPNQGPARESAGRLMCSRVTEVAGQGLPGPGSDTPAPVVRWMCGAPAHRTNRPRLRSPLELPATISHKSLFLPPATDGRVLTLAVRGFSDRVTTRPAPMSACCGSGIRRQQNGASQEAPSYGTRMGGSLSTQGAAPARGFFSPLCKALALGP
jgi:hypothetical protein